jgi:hypothetical protein
VLFLFLACAPDPITLGDTPDVAPASPVDDLLEELGDAPDTGDPPGDDDVPDVLFDEGQILPLSLTLGRDAVSALQRRSDELVEATLGYGDRTWEVGVRIKGSSTWTSLDDKPSLVVDANFVVPGQEFMGHKKFNLHNQLIDPSMMSEAMSYKYYRDVGLPASRTGYVRLTLNGADYGVYNAVEALNDDFLEARFANPDGNMYEGNDCDIDGHCVEAEEQDEGNDDALARLVAAVDLPDDAAWEAAMHEQLDWDMFIRGMAMDALIAHWDGYTYDRSNYHLYHDPVLDKWTIITQSMDLDYGWRPWSYNTCGRYGVDPGTYTEGLLGRRCLASTSCRAEFVAELLVLNDAFEAADPVGRVDELTALISADVASDRHKHYSTADFEDHVACVRAWVAQRPDEIRAWAAGQR